MRMNRFLPPLVALLLAACATGSKTSGTNAQVEVDSHELLGDIAFERQQLDTAANEYLAAALLSDQPALAAEAVQLERDHIAVRIVPLFASPPNRRYFAAIFGDNVFVDPSVFTHTAKRHAQAIAAAQPWGLLALGILLVLLLAGNERWNSRLSIGATT